MIGTVLRVVAAAFCAGIDAAVPSPAVEDARRYADILTEAEEELEVFEPLDRCSVCDASAVSTVPADGPDPATVAPGSGQPQGWRPSRPTQTTYRGPGFMYGTPIPASLCATEGKPCHPICEGCRVQPTSAAPQDWSAPENSHSGDGADQPLAQLLIEAVDCIEVLLMVDMFVGTQLRNPECADLVDRLRAAAAQVDDTN